MIPPNYKMSIWKAWIFCSNVVLNKCTLLRGIQLMNSNLTRRKGAEKPFLNFSWYINPLCGSFYENKNKTNPTWNLSMGLTAPPPHLGLIGLKLGWSLSVKDAIRMLMQFHVVPIYNGKKRRKIRRKGSKWFFVFLGFLVASVLVPRNK